MAVSISVCLSVCPSVCRSQSKVIQSSRQIEISQFRLLGKIHTAARISPNEMSFLPPLTLLSSPVIEEKAPQLNDDDDPVFSIG